METYGQPQGSYQGYFSIFFAIALCIYIYITAAVAATGKRKGLSYGQVFAFAFFATPIAGLLYVIANLQPGLNSFTAAGTYDEKEEQVKEPAPAEEAIKPTTDIEPAATKGKWDVF